MRAAVRYLPALALVVAAGFAHAQASREQSSPGQWSDKVYRWSYNPAGHPSWLSSEAAKALMLEAAAKWEVCGLHMEYVGDTQREPGRMDGDNVGGWSRRLPRNMRGVTLGRAQAGQLIERDIVFAADREEFRAHPELLKKVLVHEFGHAIGLTHSAHCDDVMTLAADCARADPSTLPLAPTPHDIERCRAIYAPRENNAS
jgi:hypothetical protein